MPEIVLYILTLLGLVMCSALIAIIVAANMLGLLVLIGLVCALSACLLALPFMGAGWLTLVLPVILLGAAILKSHHSLQHSSK